MDGIVILRGAGIPAGAGIEGANIMDIAPTTLALMSLPIPPEMDGKVLFGAETRASGQGDSPQKSTSAGEARASGQGWADENPYSEEDEEQVMERLRELGYVA